MCVFGRVYVVAISIASVELQYFDHLDVVVERSWGVVRSSGWWWWCVGGRCVLWARVSLNLRVLCFNWTLICYGYVIPREGSGEKGVGPGHWGREERRGAKDVGRGSWSR